MREDKKKQRVAPQLPQITTKEGPSSNNANPAKPKEANANPNPARPVKVAVRTGKQPQQQGEKEKEVATAPKASHQQPQEPTPSTLSMEEIFPLCVDSTWSVKVNGFENLKKKLETAHHEVGAKQQRVLDLILEGLSDKVGWASAFYSSFHSFCPLPFANVPVSFGFHL